MEDPRAEPVGIHRAIELHQALEDVMVGWRGSQHGLEELARRCVMLVGGTAASVWMQTEGEREPSRAVFVEAWRTGGLAVAGGPAAGLDVAFAVAGSDDPMAVIGLIDTELSEDDSLVLATLTSIGRTLGSFLEQRGERLDPPLLSPRETEVLQLAADGLKGPEIAEQLNLSGLTVKSHFAHIYRKLETQDRAGAVARALRRGAIR